MGPPTLSGNMCHWHFLEYDAGVLVGKLDLALLWQQSSFCRDACYPRNRDSESA